MYWREEQHYVVATDRFRLNECSIRGFDRRQMLYNDHARQLPNPTIFSILMRASCYLGDTFWMEPETLL
jgi:hypothetical protein